MKKNFFSTPFCFARRIKSRMTVQAMSRTVIHLLVALILSLKITSVFADEIRYDSNRRKDPFAPLVGPDGKFLRNNLDIADFKIEGVIFDPNGGSVVLIDGESYKEGDNINGLNIISIMKDRVILAQSQQEQTIWLREEVVD